MLGEQSRGGASCCSPLPEFDLTDAYDDAADELVALLELPRELQGCPRHAFASHWWPQKGYVTVKPYSRDTTKRDIYNNFSWASWRLQNLRWHAKSGGVTYEHETIFYNYDGRSYVGRASSSYTNLPYGYLDNQELPAGWGDAGADELNYAMGTADGTALKASTTCYTLIRTSKGDAGTDKAKVQGQRGERVPTTCFSANCVYSRATERLIPAWELIIPATSARWWDKY